MPGASVRPLSPGWPEVVVVLCARRIVGGAGCRVPGASARPLSPGRPEVVVVLCARRIVGGAGCRVQVCVP